MNTYQIHICIFCIVVSGPYSPIFSSVPLCLLHRWMYYTYLYEWIHDLFISKLKWHLMKRNKFSVLRCHLLLAVVLCSICGNFTVVCVANACHMPTCWGLAHRHSWHYCSGILGFLRRNAESLQKHLPLTDLLVPVSSLPIFLWGRRQRNISIQRPFICFIYKIQFNKFEFFVWQWWCKWIVLNTRSTCQNTHWTS